MPSISESDTGARNPLASGPVCAEARVSPRGPWVSFHFQGQQRQRPTEVWIAPLHDGTAGPPAEWIRLEGGSGMGLLHAWWSPAGGMLYFVSRGGRGQLAVYGQALDPASALTRI